MSTQKGALRLGERLAQARMRVGLSQEAVAEALGTTARSISRWEHGQSVPRAYYHAKLCELLHVAPEALFGQEVEPPVMSGPAFWHVPQLRNPLFTGREQALHALHERFHNSQQETSSRIQVLSGLGGMGKTQTAIEYAYRFRQDYQAVLWIGAETAETIMAAYLHLATLFQLPEKGSSDLAFVREAVKRWLQHRDRWLLIFDNVEEFDLLSTAIPATSGHILVTTQSQIVGKLGEMVALPKLPRTDGMLFLLRRAKLLSPEAHLNAAKASWLSPAETLVDLLDGLPLALDQAGAYIEETACGLSAYLAAYTRHRRILLNTRGEQDGHPASVYTTFSLQIASLSPRAADVLRLCAFLHADDIPEELLTQQGARSIPSLRPLADNPLLLNEVIRELRRFSLLHRDAVTGTLHIHRLLQAIMQEGLDRQERQAWLARLIEGMVQVFPDYRDLSFFEAGLQPECQRCLPHALRCLEQQAEEASSSRAEGELCYRLGVYVQLLGHHAQAFTLLQRAVHVAKQCGGEKQQTVVFYLNELGQIAAELKQLAQAQAFFQEALTRAEQGGEAENANISASLWGLASVFLVQGQYAQADALAQRSLAIKQRVLGEHHPEVGGLFNTLGAIATRTGDFARAEASFRQALNIYETALGSDHYLLASGLRNLGHFHVVRGEYEQAFLAYQRALHIHERHFGSVHPMTASALSTLSQIAFAQQRYQEAEAFCQRAIQIYERLPPPESCFTAYSLIDLGQISHAQHRPVQARQALVRALALLGNELPIKRVDHHVIAHCLLLAGDHLAALGNVSRAQSYYQRAFIAGEKQFGADHPFMFHCRQKLS